MSSAGAAAPARAAVVATPAVPLGDLIAPIATLSTNTTGPRPSTPIDAAGLVTDRARGSIGPSGTRRLDITAAPTRWRDGGGGWTDIDLALVDDGAGALRARRGSDVRLGGRSGPAMIRLATPGGPVLVSHRTTSNVAAAVTGATATYRDALGPGRRLMERITAFGVEEELVIDDRSAMVDRYRVELAAPGSLEARQAPGAVELVDTAGEVVFVAAGGLAHDAAPSPAGTGAETPVTAHLVDRTGATVVVEFRIDPAWAASPDRVFPVTIDPTYSVGTYNYDGCPTTYNDSPYLSCDTYVNSDNPYAGTYSWQTQLRAGSPGFASASPDDPGAPNRTRAFIKFPTDGYGVTGYTVTKAEVTLHLYDGFAADGITAVYGQWKSVTTATAWQNQTGGSDPGLGRDAYRDRQRFVGPGPVAGSVVYDVTALAQRWFDGYPNHGIRLEAPDEYDPAQFRKFYSGEGGYCGTAGCVNRSPRLVVEFEPVVSPAPNELLGRANPSQVKVTCMTAWNVNCANGNYVWDSTDLEVAGRGEALRFTRTHNSQGNLVDGPLGLGWTHNYDMRLDTLVHPSGERDPRIIVYQENGSRVHFTPLFGVWRAKSNVLATLTQDGTGFSFHRIHDLTTFRFDLSGRLMSIRDRNGWTTTLTRQGSRLVAVTDPAGRSLSFTYWPSGKLRAV
ncbi:MAG: DUF6531 domain-containing protein, partial [Acidimicrobiales bacterium]